MKKFVIKVLVFFAIIALVDIIGGWGLKWLTAHAKGGFTYRDNYICDSLRTDILLSGSSRCIRHYDPQIISDSIGMSCYNSGQMGNGIILNYGRLLMINKHRKPKLVIYDLHPNFDMLVSDDNHKYLTWLKGHYDRDGIADIFSSVDKTERYKMMSQLYRYNSRIIELVSDFLQPLSNANPDGFSPLIGEIDGLKIRKHVEKQDSYRFDKLKLEYIKKFIQVAGAEHIIFVVSPIWYGMDTLQFQPVKDICEQQNIPFIDYSNSPKYVHNDYYFKDGSHMNYLGAEEFTKDLVKDLRRIVVKKQETGGRRRSCATKTKRNCAKLPNT